MTRAEAIQATLKTLNEQLAENGGSWEAWSQKLQPYRDDIIEYRNPQKFKWPWPAQNGYYFQGVALELHLRDSLNDFPDGQRPLDAIIHLNKQLQALNIDLIVALIPSKLSIYPDFLYATEAPERPARIPDNRLACLSVFRLMHDLLSNDVEVINLHEAFRQYRFRHGDDKPLFYVQDSHYLNRGAQLSAEVIAERLKRYDFVQKNATLQNPFEASAGSRNDGQKADDSLRIVKDRNGNLYRNVGDAPVFLIGDSHIGYNNQNGAFFSAQLAYALKMPVSEAWKEGLSNEIPTMLARDRNLSRRRVVILHYTERMLYGRDKQWPIVNFPSVQQPASTSDLKAALLQMKKNEATSDGWMTGVIAARSKPPTDGADYPHYIMKFHLVELTDSAGKPFSEKSCVANILAMHQRKILPVSKAAVGEKLKLKLTPWEKVEKQFGTLQSGILENQDLELELPQYWAELEGQPKLELKGDGITITPQKVVVPVPK